MLSGSSTFQNNNLQTDSILTKNQLKNLKNLRVLGVCLGASTVSFVKLFANQQNAILIEEFRSINHVGNPKSVFLENLKHFAARGIPVVVTGRKFRNLVTLKTISESEATEYAVKRFIEKGLQFSASASLGAESFVVYALDENGKIRKLISNIPLSRCS